MWKKTMIAHRGISAVIIENLIKIVERQAARQGAGPQECIACILLAEALRKYLDVMKSL